jgi:hypothetical protein
MRTRLATLLGIAAVAISTASILRANGAEFFEAENDGRVVLYYFGSIKDSKGAPVDKVMVTITARNVPGGTYPFRNDSPGHFRSPDIGKAIEGMQKKVDPAQIEITVTKDGYKITRAPKIPVDKTGAVQLDGFVLDPVK